MPAENTLTLESMKAIAELAAHKAVEQLVAPLRDEIRNEFAHFQKSMLEQMDQRFAQHFGDVTPSDHIIQHSEMNTFLNMVKDVKKNFWHNLMGSVFKYGVTTFLALYFAYTQYQGAQ